MVNEIEDICNPFRVVISIDTHPRGVAPGLEYFSPLGE